MEFKRIVVPACNPEGLAAIIERERVRIEFGPSKGPRDRT
jgi:hypothetical protein